MFEKFFKPKSPETADQAETAIKKVMGIEFKAGSNFFSVRNAYDKAIQMNSTFPENIRLTQNRILNILRDEAYVGNELGEEFIDQAIRDEVEKIRKENENEPQ